MGAISVGAVFSTTRLQAQFSVKYCIQMPFVENMTALIKMWRFLEGILSPSAEKKGQAEGGTLYASRCVALAIFPRLFFSKCDFRAQ